MAESTQASVASGAPTSGLKKERFLCLTICGYRKEGLSEEAYRKHMTEISSVLGKDLMARYGIVRWTMIHNSTETREQMKELFDQHFLNIADYDCFSQVVFRSIEDYKRMREDPEYIARVKDDPSHFADFKRSQMTIGYIEEFIRDGVACDGFEGPPAK